MKTILISGVVLLSQLGASALADSNVRWSTTVQCNNRALVLDVGYVEYEGQVMQLVVNDGNIVDFFARNGAVLPKSVVNGKIIVPMHKYHDSRQVTFVGSIRDYSNSIRPSVSFDYRLTLNNRGGALLEAERNNAQHYPTREVYESWYFEQCQIVAPF
ncbi:MAG TPA: hypothetical protein DCS07_07090 [Bdellovibrionales bacterium]|nr:MAG: hypothetical protein A2Z97_07070 [Bdellovibrionales bacterium GWB1_52_6]OFZ06283.1 MAG: hypothetical protein A2X97_02355 [Bdellovibrionales bacterium GWA1_52_35]OFZ36130.1 MAG: hypothetical protein A2070_04360 [Bdellovibrionales bacterium GWC1_52_8]HAR42384.1 hypothetical protein [Bdellovibrionales bacterium]HCM40032.1 hypothetical protein [Bdellovibrionales bacterium]